jgi:hypothetical protein
VLLEDIGSVPISSSWQGPQDRVFCIDAGAEKRDYGQRDPRRESHEELLQGIDEYSSSQI